MAHTDFAQCLDQSPAVSRARFLRQAGLAAAGVAVGGALPDVLTSRRAHAAISFAKGKLNVTYWSNVAPKQKLLAVLNSFAKKYSMRVKYTPLPPVFGDVVQKLTTYLSSGYTGLDVLWLDDFMTASFSTAKWLEPLETQLPHETVSAVVPALIKLSTYNGHLYRLPASLDVVIFFYRKDLFEKEGLSTPRTWTELVQAGKRLSKGGRYGIGIAGKNGNTELFNEMSYWMGQAGADPLHMTTKGARKALQFMYDMINTYKIAPPDTVSADYSTLSAGFQDGRFAMWPVWDGFIGTFQANTKFWRHSKVAIAVPPRGPVNNSTLSACWGWSISTFSKNKDMATTFIQYAASPSAEDTLALTGSTPARVAELSNPRVTRVLHQAPYLALYAKEHLLHSRAITAQAQRISDATEAVINRYLNKQISLDTAVTEAQQRVDQIHRLG
jgi:multiple sugar transport system substrate-binding protein